MADALTRSERTAGYTRIQIVICDTFTDVSVPRPRGIVLVIALVISVVVALFLAAAVQLLPTMSRSAANLKDREVALSAAQSGVAYARNRLQADPKWRGDGNGLIVNSPEFKVLEDNGNVFGFLTPENGEPSFFRLRFNYQDGGDENDTSDHLPDPASGRFIESPYVSFNNLRSADRQEQYRATPIDGVWQVRHDSPVASLIPKFCSAVIVEGFPDPRLET